MMSSDGGAEKEVCDVTRDRQMAPCSLAATDAVEEEETRAGNPLQLSSDIRGVDNAGFDDCGSVDIRFVDIHSVELRDTTTTTQVCSNSCASVSVQESSAINSASNSSSSVSCNRNSLSSPDWNSCHPPFGEEGSLQQHCSRLRISPRSPRIRRICPRRLWFERNHWGSSVATPPDQDVLLLEEEDLSISRDKSKKNNNTSSPSRVVYSIGIFYSDTDQCESARDGFPSDKQVGEEEMTTNNSGVGEGLGLPRRLSNRNSSRRTAQHVHTQLTPDTITPDSPTADANTNSALPDILNSHLPPPYSTLPPDRGGGGGGRRLPPPSHPPPPPPPPPPCPHLSPPRRTSRGTGAFRGFHPRERGAHRAGRGHSGTFSGAASESEEPKHCCGVMVTQTVSIRWFIVMIAFVGLCCAIVGTVLGALKATGREHLTVSLLMIGVGIVLITVSGIAWRLTSHDAPSCRAMLGLQQHSEQEPNRRFVPRVPPYGRPHHPYAAMMYPEFQYRPPPPSYQASMQEYRLRLLLLDRQQGSTPSTGSALSPVSPPPTYRSHTTVASGTLHSRPPLTLTEREYSRPPSYRSRASSAGVLRPSTETLCSLSSQPNSQPPVLASSHSRNPSLSLSFLSHESLFLDSGHSRPTQPDNVHFTSPSGESQNSVVGGLSDESPASRDGGRASSWGRGAGSWKPHPHDVNAVTIVQTTDCSQVLNRDTVILSVPGRDIDCSTSAAGEVRILAHV